jgi:MoaD family protein
VSTVQVNFYATLRAAVGRKSLDLALSEGATVMDLAREIARRWPALADRLIADNGDLSRQVHFLVGGRNVRWLPDGAQTALGADAVVDVFPPSAGG